MGRAGLFMERRAPASQESAALQRHLPARPATHLGSVAALDVAERRVRVHNAGVTPAGAARGAGRCRRRVTNMVGGATKCGSACGRQQLSLPQPALHLQYPDQQWWQQQALTGF